MELTGRRSGPRSFIMRPGRTCVMSPAVQHIISDPAVKCCEVNCHVGAHATLHGLIGRDARASTILPTLAKEVTYVLRLGGWERMQAGRVAHRSSNEGCSRAGPAGPGCMAAGDRGRWSSGRRHGGLPPTPPLSPQRLRNTKSCMRESAFKPLERQLSR